MSTKGVTIWFTGISGSGKTTLGKILETQLLTRGHKVQLLDNDEIRPRLCKGLGFISEDRNEATKRVAYVASLLTRNEVICIVCTISPYNEARDSARIEIGNFIEVYCKCPVDVCRQRDVKGLYKLVDEGRIKNFTGVDDPYEEPQSPELVLKTHELSVEDSVRQIISKLESLGFISKP